ncbi:MAG: GNAT family N-acetyltransferase [Bacillota bacterium]|nr:GNAT family N-acetyltransferase [Bacillota bacterium]
MLRKYNRTDTNAIIEYLQDAPELQIIFEANHNTEDHFHFDGFVSNDKMETVMLIFGGSIYLKADEDADFEEIAGLINLCNPVDLQTGIIEADRLKPYLKRVKNSSNYKLARYEGTPEVKAPKFEIKPMDIYPECRAVYDLLCSAEMSPGIPLDRYYVTRKHFINISSSRTYFAVDGENAVSTASTMVETQNGAYLYAVATHPDYRNRGLATEVVSKLIGDLTAEGKTCYISFRNPAAESVYKKLGFKVVCDKTITWFERE